MLAKFEVYFDGEYWCARGIGADVFTQGRTVDELMGNIKEAAALHLEEESYRDVKVHLVSEGTSAVRRFANGDLYD